MQFDDLVDDSVKAPIKQGAVTQGVSFDDLVSDEDKYGTAGQKVLSGLEGGAQGVVGPLAPMAEKYVGEKLGYSPESIEQGIRGRAEENPWTHGLSEAATFGGTTLLTGGTSAEARAALEAGTIGAEAAKGTSAIAKMAKNFTLPGLSEQAGAGVAKLVGLDAANMAIKAKIAAGAVKVGTEMALLQSADEATKYITHDPDQSAQSALANIGLASGIGIFTGGVLKAGGIGVNAALEKTGLNGTGLKEFTDRLAYRGANAHPEELVQKEFSDAMEQYHAINDEVTGANGLRSQVIEKTLPKELSPAITDQVKEIGLRADEAMQKMAKDQVPERYQKKFINDFNQYLTAVTDPAATVSAHFDALNDLKKTMQGYSKGNYGPFAIPSYHEAYDFLNITKNIGRDVRVALEDSKVWGDAANLQKDLNKSWSNVLPAIKDAQGKFMSKINGEFVMDPAKIKTFLNQNGKSTSQTIRQQMMGNFVDSFQKYQNSVDKIYQRLGIENPHAPVGLGALKESLEKVSPWAKAADLWYDKMVSRSLGEGAGASVGAAAGHSTGIPGAGIVGAYLGKQIGENILPSIIQPMLEKTTNLQGFQQTIKYGQSILSGQNKLINSAKAVFGGAGKIIPSNVLSNRESVDKLDAKLKKVQESPDSMFANLDKNQLGHYVPDHAAALAKTTQKAVNFLNSIRPSNPKMSPLDAEHKPTQEQEAGFHRALEIADQPISIMKRIKDGTILPQDIKVLTTLYPKLYTEMSKELMMSMSEHIDDGHEVPYRLRQSLSLFLAQPLDSTMTPGSIMAAQMSFLAKNLSPQMMAPKEKTQKLSKLGQESMTKNQATEARHNRLT